MRRDGRDLVDSSGDTRPTVVELFAGVGGFALGLEGKVLGFDRNEGWTWDRQGGRWRVAWANQWEPSTKTQHAADCYRDRFPDTPIVDADIGAVLDHAFDITDSLEDHAFDGTHAGQADDTRRELAREIADAWRSTPLPEHFDLLVGGFPCQDYSVAKPLSQATGIVGQKGVLWWEIERILRHRRPKHVLLENVDRLLKSPSDQRGRDFAIMLTCFAYHGYEVEWRVINAAHYGFPQRRRRVFIYAQQVDASEGAGNVNGFATLANRMLAEEGVMAEAFPCEITDGRVVTDLLGDDDNLIELQDLSESWPSSSSGPWEDAGVMRGGLVFTASVSSPSDGTPEPLLGRTFPLGEVLLPVEHVLKDEDLHEFLIPGHQLDFSDDPDRSSWNYMKGAKSERREKSNGFVYHYSEGAINFPEPLDQAARTVLTGEGGATPSRFKLVVSQRIPDELVDHDWPDRVRDAFIDPQGPVEVYRRLTPIELERLNMFEDNWTAAVDAAGRRAFCMGNALVVGVVQRLGDVIADRL